MKINMKINKQFGDHKNKLKHMEINQKANVVVNAVT